MRITRIRVPASWLTEGGSTRHLPAEFTLGLGPCGLTVTTLQLWWSDGCLCIKQSHTDGTVKRFIYPLTQLHGRVEVEYGG
ncbi:hypothetical protein [Sphingomonas sp. BK580]|uniref:hypothetical protein n=1 Tax=Sphingomonas sp. BK580 TaxID=2586972 RepID=UPI00160CE621|nr:hypothetical protein [Sphingomonas sp. BK580]MBB3693035.1 hypothetical protein [Sphingomonas sp. BK580]